MSTYRTCAAGKTTSTKSGSEPLRRNMTATAAESVTITVAITLITCYQRDPDGARQEPKSAITLQSASRESDPRSIDCVPLDAILALNCQSNASEWMMAAISQIRPRL